MLSRKWRKSKKAACSLASDRGHHEFDAYITVKPAENFRLYLEQSVVKLFLVSCERNGYSLRLSNGELADIATSRSVDNA